MEQFYQIFIDVVLVGFFLGRIFRGRFFGLIFSVFVFFYCREEVRRFGIGLR